MKRSGPPWQLSALTAILFLGLLLRLAPWGFNRFLEDEALYAYWGLQIATGADPMLDEEPVDKPPLYPYTLALSFLLSAPHDDSGRETAARLPSLLASMASIALVYALGHHLFDTRTGLLAALLLAVSPFDILFASTAFTDPLMVALVLGALVAAAGDRPGLAGLLAGLAAAAKQQGLLFLPLIVAIGLLAPGQTGSRRGVLPTNRLPGWLRFALGFALVLGAALCWDLSRLQRPGFFAQSLISYGGLAPVPASTLLQRGAEWLKLVAALWISPCFNAFLVVAWLAWLLGGIAGWWQGWTRIDVALGSFVIAYLLLHWLVGFRVWDRYLLGLVPLVALLAARAFMAFRSAIRAVLWKRVYTVLLLAVLVAALTGPAVAAARSELPYGGDHGAYDGIDDLAAYMRAQAPPGSVLYHYWLGYHYRFYLYGAPLRLHWYPNLMDLVRDARIYRREPRYIAFPSWTDPAPVIAALNEAGIQLVPLFQTTRRDGSSSFELYRLDGP
jgi:4-amino-4-deoxy-L-arabinose transferase-like glycosyltransferase